jgi:hypothetical protein
MNLAEVEEKNDLNSGKMKENRIQEDQ